MSHALDLVGERWALLVVRELMYGPKRFTDLRHGLPNASPNVLSQRLRELEEIGVLRRRRLGPPVGAWAYELTDWGRGLEPVLLGLTRWGDRSPLRDADAVASPDSLMFALRSRFDPDADPGLEAAYHLRLGDHDYDVRVAHGAVNVRRGEPMTSDAVVEVDVRDVPRPGPRPALDRRGVVRRPPARHRRGEGRGAAVRRGRGRPGDAASSGLRPRRATARAGRPSPSHPARAPPSGSSPRPCSSCRRRSRPA